MDHRPLSAVVSLALVGTLGCESPLIVVEQEVTDPASSKHLLGLVRAEGGRSVCVISDGGTIANAPTDDPCGAGADEAGVSHCYLVPPDRPIRLAVSPAKRGAQVTVFASLHDDAGCSASYVVDSAVAVFEGIDASSGGGGSGGSGGSGAGGAGGGDGDGGAPASPGSAAAGPATSTGETSSSSQTGAGGSQ